MFGLEHLFKCLNVTQIFSILHASLKVDERAKMISIEELIALLNH